ncbi:hypothetical protein ROJ8625_03918 [Roseivivax jejudonensis]|uniref:Uncharacterized protein n=1 Tax=Roseivivax jejudonensis TaxID=1529041 RepID=A0A1X7A8M0_9RHOB|nr:hypothetical protein [Roseivivax jejudonensis]SLN73341.1 hypothetical protein ROJ8625_03918 [Roseivivax jejudonensis]
MRIMILSMAVLAIGALLIALKPLLGGAPIENAEVPGVFPEWIAPVGYFTMLVGAAGLFIGWTRARSAR